VVRSFIYRHLAVVGALIALTMWPASVFAQSSSLFGGSSSSSSRGGTSGSNRSSAGTSGSGRSTTGQSGFGGGQGQAGGRGQGGLGQGGTGTGQFGLSGQQTGQNGFVGRSDNSGRFVGNQGIGQQGSNSAGPNFSGLGGGRGSNSGSNRNNSFGNNGLGSGERKLPVPLTKIAFKYSTPETEALTGRLSTRLAKSSRITEAGVLNQQIGVEMEDGGVARLTGSVETSEQKSLIEAYVRLEPGVRKIVSEIAVSYADPPAKP
jgi:hypothetical protein